jgi:hypothetical protein
MTLFWNNTVKEVSKRYASSAKIKYQEEDITVIHAEFALLSTIITAHGLIIVLGRATWVDSSYL